MMYTSVIIMIGRIIFQHIKITVSDQAKVVKIFKLRPQN
jgi:hypothetical protein